MEYQEILKHPPRVLTREQRALYYEQGYLLFPELIKADALEILRDVTQAIVENSRAITESSRRIDLEKGHCAESPRLRRVTYSDEEFPELWELCADSIITDIAADLVGPNVRFRELMLNFKWADGGAEVKWHQDFVFYPHTHTGTMQFLLFLEDVGSDQGPLQVIPNSHKGPIFEHYSESGAWTGAIRDSDMRSAGLGNAVELTGSAGTVSVHHSRTIHGSKRNDSEVGRPAYVLTYAAADAAPYTAPAYPSTNYRKLVRGVDPGYAHHEALHVPLPPDWSDGYTSIYDHQEKEL
ncbi:MAG: phytanoyl-CoA dioxygenase family protein [Pseudomonadota bacterium]